MRFTAAVAGVLISACTVQAQDQKLKDPTLRVGPTTVGSAHSAVAPTSVTNSSASSAARLAKIEQQTARVHSNETVAHRPSTSVAATPALDLGKNKPVRVGRSPQSVNQMAPNNNSAPKLH